MMNRLSPGMLLKSDGTLAEAGFAVSPVKTYDRSMIKAGALRIKEWDYYLVCNDSFAVALTIDDNAYMGLLSASFIDLEKSREHTKSPVSLFPMGKTKLPPSSETGDAVYSGRHARAAFRHEGAARVLSFYMDDFAGGEPFCAEITLNEPPRDTMVIATPFAGKPKAFYYNQKIVGMRAAGSVSAFGREYVFDPAVSFGLLDWGRGVWTYDNTWYWSAAQGVQNGRVFGWNLGYGFGDTSAATENMLFIDGIAHKLGDVDFGIPQKDGRDDFMSRWHFTSTDGRFEAEFTPLIDRAAKTSALVLLSDQHQVFGRFDGRAVTDGGETFEFRGLTGFAEKVRNKW